MQRQAGGEIQVHGVRAGTATITATDVNTGAKATMKVIVK